MSTTVLRLVRKFGKMQPSILWENVLDILDHLHELIKVLYVADCEESLRNRENFEDSIVS